MHAVPFHRDVDGERVAKEIRRDRVRAMFVDTLRDGRLDADLLVRAFVLTDAGRAPVQFSTTAASCDATENRVECEMTCIVSGTTFELAFDKAHLEDAIDFVCEFKVTRDGLQAPTARYGFIACTERPLDEAEFLFPRDESTGPTAAILGSQY